MFKVEDVETFINVDIMKDKVAAMDRTLARGRLLPKIYEPTPTGKYGTEVSPEFDCELPPSVRTEFFRPTRARILLPLKPPKKLSWGDYAPSWDNAAVLGICGLFFALALADGKRITEKQ